ncbi:MAG: hypothetical protein JSW05_11025 [Candidatus Thorarchaeota archaeon]|nr:MAG: hypothetical protein JSW05_11025 [Candidatus Thorarchaeota archaeon]
MPWKVPRVFSSRPIRNTDRPPVQLPEALDISDKNTEIGHDPVYFEARRPYVEAPDKVWSVVLSYL